MQTHVAYFAGGCFWGVEYYFEKQPGVVSAVSGFMGGAKENPSYMQVVSGTTGHVETVAVTYDPGVVSFEELAKLFFEIHDPTQVDGQGPDLGSQYLSVIFYTTEEEQEIATRLISILQDKGIKAVTTLLPAGTFWEAEDYHQDYYTKNGEQPYCHFRRRIF
ncbi:MAG: peptide-methionine (S)-S-oxide reductase MsrA [Patescibacteria group bacterium]